MTSPAALTATSAATMRPLGSVMAALPMPPFIAAAHARRLADRGARAGADAAFRDGAVGGRARRLVAAVGGRTDPAVADRQIEDRRGRNNRHVGGAELEADLLLFEIPHDAGRGVEAERAAAGQDDRVRDLDEVDRVEQIGLARGGRRAAHVHAGRGAGLGQDHRAAGRALRQRVVSDLDARHGRQRLVSTALRADRRGRRRQQRENPKRGACAHRPIPFRGETSRGRPRTARAHRRAWRRCAALRESAPRGRRPRTPRAPSACRVRGRRTA